LNKSTAGEILARRFWPQRKSVALIANWNNRQQRNYSRCSTKHKQVGAVFLYRQVMSVSQLTAEVVDVVSRRCWILGSLLASTYMSSTDLIANDQQL